MDKKLFLIIIFWCKLLFAIAQDSVSVGAFLANQHGTTVTLEVQTTKEVDIAYYTFERTLISVNNWVTIGRVNSVGNSNTSQTYNFVDTPSPYLDTCFLYRFYATGFHGQLPFYYGPVSICLQTSIIENNSKNKYWEVFFNKPSNELFIKSEKIIHPVKFILFNVEGRIIYETIIHANSFTVNCTIFARGIYYYLIDDNESGKIMLHQ